MNKYITALLIVLATTGVEAQTYQLALKALLGENSIENFFTHQELNEFQNNLLSVLKTLNETEEEEQTEPIKANKVVYASNVIVTNKPQVGENKSLYYNNLALNSCHINTSVFIRGPDVV